MNTPGITELKKKPYFPGPLSLTTSFLILLGIASYLLFEHPDWWWGRIGSIIALVAVVLMLFRDQLKAYGEKFGNLEQAEKLPKIAARFVATGVTSIGAALLIISAIYQLHGDPVMIIKAPPTDLFFKPTGSEAGLDGEALIEYLNSTYDNLNRIDEEIDTMWHPDLVIVNCGADRSDEKCKCPDNTYSRVRSIGKWDLNAGTTGDGITLCYKSVLYRQPTK